MANDAENSWYEKNKSSVAQKSREWREKNPERLKALRAAKIANSRYPGTITADDIEFVIEASGRICCWCKKENLSGNDLTIEHLQPINDRQHLAVACRSCNAARLHKGAAAVQTPEEKLAKQREYERKYRERNADKIRAQKHEAYLKDQELIRLRSVVYHHEHREEVLGKMRVRSLEHRQEAAARAKKWREENPERAKEAKRLCYERKKEEYLAKMKARYEAKKAAA